MPAYDDRRFSPPAPLATVELRRPDERAGDPSVPMLIDSGADVTLLPKSVIESLGIVGTPETYQLIAFDGTTSESRAARADLVFLGRRFRGLFLVTDAEVGVLGRDVLNHIRLLLDGPAASWEELRRS
ncbi:MAG: retropepsin-like aspartic protease [Planctomycetaceae bacterium]